MEVVIGVILLIGAFALGQTTAEPGAAGDRVRLDGERLIESPDDRSFPQGCRYRLGGPVQRDLTLPYSRQQSTDGDGCEAARVAFRDD